MVRRYEDARRSKGEAPSTTDPWPGMTDEQYAKLVANGEQQAIPVNLAPVDGPRVVCSVCGRELLGQGTIEHQEDASHIYCPTDQERLAMGEATGEEQGLEG